MRGPSMSCIDPHGGRLAEGTAKKYTRPSLDFHRALNYSTCPVPKSIRPYKPTLSPATPPGRNMTFTARERALFVINSTARR